MAPGECELSQRWRYIKITWTEGGWSGREFRKILSSAVAMNPSEMRAGWFVPLFKWTGWKHSIACTTVRNGSARKSLQVKWLLVSLTSWTFERHRQVIEWSITNILLCEDGRVVCQIMNQSQSRICETKSELIGETGVCTVKLPITNYHHHFAYSSYFLTVLSNVI